MADKHNNDAGPPDLNLPSFTSTFPQIPPGSYQLHRLPAVAMASNPHREEPLIASMGPPPSRDANKKFDINSLMSPPDPVQDSFNASRGINNVAPRALAQERPIKLSPSFSAISSTSGSTKQPLPPSPPISPYSSAVSQTSSIAPTTPPGHSVRDPVLYPLDDATPSSSPQAPLFAPAELEAHRRIVEQHVRARSPSLFTGVTPPKDEDYELALFFRSQVMKHYTANRKGWLRKERELLEADRRAGAHRYHAIMPAKPMHAKAPRMQRADRVSKPQNGQTLRSIRVSTGPTPTPGRSARRISATPEPSRRSVAPNREDKDFNSLPDLCPPLSSLPSRPNSLKIDWKGQPIDLSGDPFVHLLHPDEVALAGNLRLDCATYLTSKRRIFERRLQCLRTGKEFRKTDAQQACKIDVNKASKLWTAFDKVGWLDAAWVRRFL